MELTAGDLYAKIGALTVQVELLQAELKKLQEQTPESRDEKEAQ